MNKQQVFPELNPSTPPSECIYCNSGDIYADNFEFDDISIWRAVSCKTCNKSWLEVFEFSHLEEIKLIYSDEGNKVYT